MSSPDSPPSMPWRHHTSPDSTHTTSISYTTSSEYQSMHAWLNQNLAQHIGFTVIKVWSMIFVVIIPTLSCHQNTVFVK